MRTVASRGIASTIQFPLHSGRQIRPCSGPLTLHDNSCPVLGRPVLELFFCKISPSREELVAGWEQKRSTNVVISCSRTGIPSLLRRTWPGRRDVQGRRKVRYRCSDGFFDLLQIGIRGRSRGTGILQVNEVSRVARLVKPRANAAA